MFHRQRRIRAYLYSEVVESYRDERGRPTHRTVARWRAEQSLAEAIGTLRYSVEDNQRSLAYWQGVVDRTIRPRPKHRAIAHAAEQSCARRLERDTKRLTALEAAREVVPADDSEIKRAFDARVALWREISARYAEISSLLQGR